MINSLKVALTMLTDSFSILRMSRAGQFFVPSEDTGLPSYGYYETFIYSKARHRFSRPTLCKITKAFDYYIPAF